MSGDVNAQFLKIQKAIRGEIFDAVAEAAAELSVETYVVGGYVRDFFLERECKDIDFVCVGDGIALALKVSEILTDSKSKVSVFKKYGTAMLRFREHDLEFVGARKESYSRHSRNPEVTVGSLSDDQNRRDFTINALAISLNQQDMGDLVDPFEGVKDLEGKIVKTPHDPQKTFDDDPLRMLRAVRFASQLGFDIAPETTASIMKNADRIKIVSAERISTELNKIIMSPKPSYGFNLLFETGLLAHFFPEMVALHGVDVVNGKRHKDNFYHTLKVLDNLSLKSNDLWVRWSAILHDIAKPPTKRFDEKAGWTFHGHEDKGARMVPGIFRRLKLPMGDPMKRVQKLVKLHLRPIALVKDEVSDTALRRLLFEAGDDLDDLMRLCRADITSKDHNRVKRYLANFDKVEHKLEQVEDRDKVRNFQPPVRGEHIMRTFGMPPNKDVGTIKNEIKEAILEGKIKNNFEEAYQYMLDLGKKRGLTIIEKLEHYD